MAAQKSTLKVLDGFGEGFLLSTLGTAVIGAGEKAQPFPLTTAILVSAAHPNLVVTRCGR